METVLVYSKQKVTHLPKQKITISKPRLTNKICAPCFTRSGSLIARSAVMSSARMFESFVRIGHTKMGGWLYGGLAVYVLSMFSAWTLLETREGSDLRRVAVSGFSKWRVAVELWGGPPAQSIKLLAFPLGRGSRNGVLGFIGEIFNTIH